MSKQLENLVEKAQEKGFARVNGRMRGYGYVGRLEEKYSISIKKNGTKRQELILSHWGTETLRIDTLNKKVLGVYGVGNSDRDSVNFILDKFDIPNRVHYYPSRDAFELHCSKTEKVLQVI